MVTNTRISFTWHRRSTILFKWEKNLCDQLDRTGSGRPTLIIETDGPFPLSTIENHHIAVCERLLDKVNGPSHKNIWQTIRISYGIDVLLHRFWEQLCCEMPRIWRGLCSSRATQVNKSYSHWFKLRTRPLRFPQTAKCFQSSAVENQRGTTSPV